MAAITETFNTPGSHTFTVPATVQYLDYEIDLEAQSGDSHHLLPVPAAYLVSPEGHIEFSYVAPDYTKRIDKSLVLAAAKQMFGAR